MGVMLTSKNKSYCSSCLRGAVMGGFSWICQHLHCGAAGSGLHGQGQGQRQGFAAGGRVVPEAVSSS